MVRLHDYQVEAVNHILAKLKEMGRAVLVAPCGSGKTVMFSYIVRVYVNSGKQAMIIVHRDELVQQTLTRLQEVGFPSERLAVEKADLRIDREADVVVASLQSLYHDPKAANSRLNRLLRYLPRLALVVYDECHHARAAATYDMFLHLLAVRPGVHLLGASATPYRTDTLELDEVFGDPEETWVVIPRRELEARGFLVPLKHTYLQVVSDDELLALPTVRGDYDLESLVRLVNVDKVNKAVAEAVATRRDTPGVVYACSIPHAEALLEEIVARGVPAALVTGSTPEEERHKIIAGFGKKIMCIVNVMVLTEGYDAPAMRYLVLARPTKSPVLYEQVIGRVARPAPGKQYGEVIHLVSPRVEQRQGRERQRKERRRQQRAMEAGERLARAVLREIYLGVMLRKLSELDFDGLLALARSFSELCRRACLWLPLREEGPLFTVVPCRPEYEAYRDAIFAIAGPGEAGQVVILACRAAKHLSPWTVVEGRFVHIRARAGEAVHRFLEWAGETSPYARTWLARTSDVPDTYYPKPSALLPKPTVFAKTPGMEARIKYLVSLSAAAEGFYRALLSGRLFSTQKWRTVPSEAPKWMEEDEKWNGWNGW